MDSEKQDSKISPDQEIPVGAGDYIVKAGECVSSIAYKHGHLWETILNDPANRALKLARGNHHILLPGDRLTIPPIRTYEAVRPTDMLHKFELKAVPEVFQLRFLDRFDEPRANLPYELVIDFETFRGTTDAEGALKHPIPPNARQGRITLGSGNDTEEIELRLGDLNPRNTTSGAQARLANLGLDCGPIDGILGPKTRKALQRFQKLRKLKQTGELDGPTIKELETRHGS